MLVELAIGDAYGAGFEYVSPHIVDLNNNLDSYFKHPKHRIIPGCYTDDTQMSIAIVEAIIEDELWTPLTLANRFVTAFHRDPREGYAGRFYDFLTNIQNGQEFLDKILPNSDKSGAAMRACPIGVYASIPTIIERCTLQAKLTHNTPDGINAALAASLMTHYFLYNLGPKSQLPEFLHSYANGLWHVPWSGKVGAKGMMSVRAAITALLAHDSLADVLRASIAFTGDVDTVATIALGAAAGSDQYKQDIPEHLFFNLENGEYGRNFLQSLDVKLLAHQKLSNI